MAMMQIPSLWCNSADAMETWHTATEENKGELRFFRVEVELP